MGSDFPRDCCALCGAEPAPFPLARCGEDPEGGPSVLGCGVRVGLCWEHSNLPPGELLAARVAWLEEHECLAQEQHADILEEMLQGEAHLHRARQLAYDRGLQAFAGELSLALRPVENLHRKLKTV